ncbi:MAG: GH32 C-terminal domain-containing protein [Pseudolactococcus laudensis]
MEKQKLRTSLKFITAGIVTSIALPLATVQTVFAVSSANQNSWQYNELYRNQYHYAAAQNWLNDPNGLLYDDSTDTYHMYYQYNPNGNGWGDMSWGHATSRDLVNWQEQPVAISMLENQSEMDFTFKNTTGQFTKDGKDGEVRYWGQPRTDWDGGNGKKYIFSGSTVLDKANASGLGENTILAYYTSCFQIPTRWNDGGEDGKGTWFGVSEVQEQHLAYSTDGGQTFKQFDGAKSVAENLSGAANQENPKALIPVTDVSGLPGIDAKDFRDPKVVYDEAHQQWLMVVVAGQQALIFKSDNLLNWTYASAIQRQHDVGVGVWECPELIPMKVKGSNETKWVLTMSVQDHAYASGSGMQYMVGDMDSNAVWTPATDQTLVSPNWLDYGEDFYAGVTFGNTSGRRIMLAWESNWKWTGLQKTTPWYSHMTVPRELTLVADAAYNGGYKLMQAPVAELDATNAQATIVPTLNKGVGQADTGIVLTGDMNNANAAKVTNYKGTAYKIDAEFSWDAETKPSALGMYVRGTDNLDRKLLVGYDFGPQLAYLNILSTGDADISAAGRDHTNTFVPDTGHLKLTALVDESSIEVFVNDGEKTITQVFYFRPEKIGGADIKTDNIGFYVEGGEDKQARVQNMVITPYRSIFGEITNPNQSIRISQGSVFEPLTALSFGNVLGNGTTDAPTFTVKNSTVNTAVAGDYAVLAGMTNSAGKYQEISVPVKVTPQTTVAPTAITLDVTGIKTLKKGKTIPVTVTLTPTTAVSAITWEIADPAVASIDDQGSVKGLKVGTTKIIAKTANGKSTNFTLRVTN